MSKRFYRIFLKIELLVVIFSFASLLLILPWSNYLYRFLERAVTEDQARLSIWCVLAFIVIACGIFLSTKQSQKIGDYLYNNHVIVHVGFLISICFLLGVFS